MSEIELNSFVHRARTSWPSFTSTSLPPTYPLRYCAVLISAPTSPRRILFWLPVAVHLVREDPSSVLAQGRLVHVQDRGKVSSLKNCRVDLMPSSSLLMGEMWYESPRCDREMLINECPTRGRPSSEYHIHRRWWWLEFCRD